ncbi:MAG TPA: phosphatase PAP2 family protein, partial [Bacteroidia bacterium]|nr:phosphatase PAP2 family protein [Bacteroidia bacterium]
QQVQPFEVKAIPVALADPASNGEIIKDHFRFSWPSYIVPVMVTGYGIAAYYPKVVVIDRYQAYDYFWKNYHDFHTTADNYLQFAPAAATFSLSLCGVKGKHSLGEQIILYAGSMLVSEGIATGLKYTTKILRPDNSAYNSFPSGHTTSAFTGAEMMNQEYKGSSFLYSVFGYGTATATGVLRMMNNRHWLSDVMVGAGIGMISTKLVYAVYPVLKRKYLQRKARRTFSPGS